MALNLSIPKSDLPGGAGRGGSELMRKGDLENKSLAGDFSDIETEVQSSSAVGKVSLEKKLKKQSSKHQLSLEQCHMCAGQHLDQHRLQQCLQTLLSALQLFVLLTLLVVLVLSAGVLFEQLQPAMWEGYFRTELFPLHLFPT